MDDGDALVALAAIATLSGVGLSWYLYFRLRLATIGLLNAQLAAIRPWAVGPQPANAGWSNAQIDAITEFKWHHPRLAIIPLATAGLTHLSALDNLLVGPAVRRQLVSLTQAIESFNAYQQRIEAFIASGAMIGLAVSEKLDEVFDGTKFVLPPALEAKSQFTIPEVLEAAGLTQDEKRWARYLASMVKTLHVTMIGSNDGKGMYRKLRDLEDQMRVEGLFKPHNQN